MRYRYLLTSLLILGAGGPGLVAESSETAQLVHEDSLHQIAPLAEVTVYPNQARLRRTWSPRLAAGRQTLTLEGLEYGLVSRSLQVLSQTPGVRVELVETESAHKKDVLSDQARELRAMIDREESALRGLHDELKVLRANDQLLSGLEIGRTPAGNPDSWQATPLDPESWGRILKDLSEQETRLKGELRSLERQMTERQAELQILLDRIQRLQAYEVMSRKNLLLTVTAEQAGPAMFELGYQVSGPGWFPHYQTRVDKDAGRVELSAHAVVYQGTGRDWADVPLNVSTANPAAGSDIPELQAWYLREDLNPYLQLKSKGSTAYGRVTGAGEFDELKDVTESLRKIQTESAKKENGYFERSRANFRSMDKSQLEQWNEMQDNNLRQDAKRVIRGEMLEKSSHPRPQKVQGLIDSHFQVYDQLRRQLKHFKARQVAPQTRRPSHYQGTPVRLPVSPGSWYDQEFRALTPGTIPANSEPVRVLIRRQDFEANFHYLVRPREEMQAYLIAEAPNRTGSAWLPGGMRVFFDNDFVGRSHFEGLGEAGTFRLSLGVDESVKIHRTTKMLEKDEGVFSSDRERTVEVTLEVKNLHPTSSRVRIEERLPTTTHKDAEVKLLDDGTRSTAGLVRDAAVKDRLRWTLEMEPGSTRTFTWSYSITHDEQLKLQGFQP